MGRHEPLQINRIVRAGNDEELDIFRTSRGVEDAVNHRPDKRVLEGIESAHDRHEQYRRQDLPPARQRVPNQPHQLPHGAPARGRLQSLAAGAMDMECKDLFYLSRTPVALFQSRALLTMRRVEGPRNSHSAGDAAGSRSIRDARPSTTTCRKLNCQTPPLLLATARIVPRPREPEMGIERFALPESPFTLSSPEISQSALMGSPICARTCGFAAACAIACL